MNKTLQNTDLEYLKKLITTMSFLAQSAPKQMLVIKNLQSETVFCSEYLAKLIGENVNSMLGHKTPLSLFNNDADFESILIKEDQKIIEQRLPRVLFKTVKFKNGFSPIISIKSPLINPDTRNVVGILFQGYEQGVLSHQHYLLGSESENKINDALEKPVLSTREKQVIFFFLAHLSSQEIAEMIFQIEDKRVSKSTIDGVFNDQLYCPS